MRNRRSRLWVGIGLAALCSGLTLAGWQPVEGQTTDVISLPGDAPGAKIAFQRTASLLAWSSGESSAKDGFDFPGSSEVRIETVTANCATPVGNAVLVQLQTKNGGTAYHTVALARVGTFDSADEERALYVGTHYVRLLAKESLDGSASGPPEIAVHAERVGSTSGQGACSVTVAGYTTPASPKVKPFP